MNRQQRRAAARGRHDARKKVGLDLEVLVGAADRCRHIETTAEHIIGMLEEVRVDTVFALWPDSQSVGVTAVWVVKGSDQIGKVRSGQFIAFWLQDEAHADRLVHEIERLVRESTITRGEFAPIGGDLQFEAYPSGSDIMELYVVKAGIRIARRGQPDTRERNRWMPLIPVYAATDVSSDVIQVKTGKQMLMFATKSPPRALQ